MKIAYLLFAFITLTSCITAPVGQMAAVFQCKESDNEINRIVGGQRVPYGDPDQKLVVMLEMQRENGQTVCTGTLMSNRIVLTAAHCIDRVHTDHIFVHFHTSNGCPVNQFRDQRIEVERAVIHKRFDGTPQSLSDVALVYLNEEAPSDQERLSILEKGMKLTSDKILLIGYGITGETQKDSQTLRRIHKSWTRDISVRSNSYIVNQTNGSGGFCRGDSGAPIIGEVWGEPRIVAVNSANVGITPNSECQTLSIAMPTIQFSDWIGRNRIKLEKSTWLGRVFSESTTRVE